MRVGRFLGGSGLGDVNLIVPGLVVLSGIGVSIAGRPYIGIGIAVGALLAVLNTVLLIKRVDMAAASGLAPVAMVSMQLGLLVTFTVIGGVAVVMVLINLSMTIAMAISLFGTQTAELLLYYRARRSRLGAMPAPLTSEHNT